MYESVTRRESRSVDLDRHQDDPRMWGRMLCLSLTMTDHNLSLVVPRLSSFPRPDVSSVLVSYPNPAQLSPNHVLIRVDRFGFTANNVSYQALGEVPHFR